MAYSDISKSKLHFNSNYYVGNGSTQDRTDIGFKPDFVWIKDGTGANDNQVVDSIRGATKAWRTNATDTENTHSDGLTAFLSNGFSLGSNTRYNQSGSNYRCWSWLAGGPSPAVTYKVVVVSDSGNKYRFRNSADTATFGSSAVTVDLQEGGTYTFDVSDSTVNSHPFVLGTSSGVDGSYTTGVTYKLDGVTKTYSQYTSGFSSATSRQLIITVAASAPTLYYNCSVHSGMGGQINTNTGHGSSNFDGSIQSRVSHNPLTGFSLVEYTVPSSGDFTWGHGLGAMPASIFIRGGYATSTFNTDVFHHRLSSNGIGYRFTLNTNGQEASAPKAFKSGTNSSVVEQAYDWYGNGEVNIAYCFTEKRGFSSFGDWTGNGFTEPGGHHIYTGFKPTAVMIKVRSGNNNHFFMFDEDRGQNGGRFYLKADTDETDTTSTDRVRLTSTGFQMSTGNDGVNGNGDSYVYWAWGQPIVGGPNNVPVTAV